MLRVSVWATAPDRALQSCLLAAPPTPLLTPPLLPSHVSSHVRRPVCARLPPPPVALAPADEVRRVRRHVAALVVRVDHLIKQH